MSGFTIEKGIPVPLRTWPGTGGKPKYPWKQMEVGDSIYAEGAAAFALMSACRMGVRGSRFTQRQVGNGLRVWRIA